MNEAKCPICGKEMARDAVAEAVRPWREALSKVVTENCGACGGVYPKCQDHVTCEATFAARGMGMAGKAKCATCGGDKDYCACSECYQLGGRGNRDRNPGICHSRSIRSANLCDMRQPCPACGGAR
jgi:hypothetical protein